VKRPTSQRRTQGRGSPRAPFGGAITARAIAEVRDRTDLVALIRERVPNLTMRGRDFVGPCPFHGGGEDCFHVHAQGGLYHCFHCKEGGDAFCFVQYFERCSFGDAVRMLRTRNL
jgi:DNA primase